MAAGDGLTRMPGSLILTLEMDGEAFAALQALRRKYYAPERNIVPAHVTMFGRLPAERNREIKAFLTQVASAQRVIELPPGEVRVTDQGVAIFFHSAQLSALHQSLAKEWGPWLEDEDRRGFQPHVTIQTTLDEKESRRTRQMVVATFRPTPVRGVGLHLWRYRDGPWDSERLFRFR
jgi:hypothetical protein